MREKHQYQGERGDSRVVTVNTDESDSPVRVLGDNRVYCYSGHQPKINLNTAAYPQTVHKGDAQKNVKITRKKSNSNFLLPFSFTSAECNFFILSVIGSGMQSEGRFIIYSQGKINATKTPRKMLTCADIEEELQ